MRSEDSLNTEEIVNLRLELFRAKNKVEAYDKLQQRNEMYEQIVGKLVEVLQERYAGILNIANSLGVKSAARVKDYSQLKNAKGIKEGDRTAIVKYERLSAELDAQEEMLDKISEEVARVVKHNRELSLHLEEITKVHSKCGNPDTFSREAEQKLRIMEKDIAQKEANIHQLKNKTLNLQQEASKHRTKQAEYLTRIRELQSQLDQQAKEGQIYRQAYSQSKQSQLQKKQAVSNCQKLLQLITIPSEDYLKYYFRSSGLQMQPQRQQKNKYSIVFDN